MKRYFLTIALGMTLANAVCAGTYEWTSGWAQGVTENMVDDGNGNSLNISCPDEDGAESDVRAYASIAGKNYSSKDNTGGFDVIVDGKSYSNPFETNCDACASIFPTFWKALRVANNLQISADGKIVNLPTKNVRKILLPLDSKKNSCRVTW
jgi:hypothetical protein